MARAKAVLESVPQTPTAPRPAKKNGKNKRVPSPKQVYERRYVQTVRSIDLWSVLKVSICFYLSALIISLAAAAMLWSIPAPAGASAHVQKSARHGVGDHA